MSLIAIVLVFIMAIVVTVFISHLLPVKVPLPLIQIAAGAALAAGGFQVDFDPHIFLLLFIPPLLFLDGWRIPKDAFFRDMKPILSLAIGLVMVTILGIGLFIHWLIPAITVAAGFSLAAILSPTDPVAVSAMTASSPLPGSSGRPTRRSNRRTRRWCLPASSRKKPGARLTAPWSRGCLPTACAWACCCRPTRP